MDKGENFFKIIRSIAIILIIVLIISVIISNKFGQDVWIPMILTFAVAVFIPIILVRPILEIELDLKFKNALNELKNEIELNYQNLTCISLNIKEVDKKWKSGEKNIWIKKEYPGIIRDSQYGTHCFKLFSFEFFSNEGFIATREKNIEKGHFKQIIYFYKACINFTNESQNIENDINLLISDENFDISNAKCEKMINEYIDKLNSITNLYFNRICNSYKELKNFLEET